MAEEQEGSLLAGEQAKTWYSDENRELVEQNGWKDPNDPIRDYSELQKSASGKVKLPTEDSSAEEVSAFYAKIRGVDSPDGYEIDVPENVDRDEDMEKTIRQVAFENGGNKVAVESMIKKYYEMMGQRLAQSRLEGENWMKDTWKDNQEGNLTIAKRFINEGPDGFAEFLKDTGLGNHPRMLEAAYHYGQKILSDSLVRGDTTGKEEGGEYIPAYKDSPDMYRGGDDEESKKARAYFEARGHKY